MIVSLVKRLGVPVSVCCDHYCFGVEGSYLVEPPGVRMVLEGKMELNIYQRAWSLANFAWACQEFDEVIEN